ncbi:hypothetical protein AAIL47_05255 [Limosilactobacillus fermentum]|uniref:hypothetical protein n=1 Tax=Limosilactobacillus fermentum TaxID=1613 RepID=UPI003C2F12B0
MIISFQVSGIITKKDAPIRDTRFGIKIKHNQLYWSELTVSIIPTIDEKTAANSAKYYLKQFKGWQLVSLRVDENNPRATDQAQREHVKAMFKLQEWQNIIKAISKDDQASSIILDQRFIKQHSTKRTLAELAAKQHSITEGNFYHRQHKALLMAYNLIPSDQVKLVRCE